MFGGRVKTEPGAAPNRVAPNPVPDNPVPAGIPANPVAANPVEVVAVDARPPNRLGAVHRIPRRQIQADLGRALHNLTNFWEI